ncbi:MAG: 2-oxoacid:acceptor oxidoreductase subunit alpha [Flavobacteriaceae bacterium]|jgi:2-oxoglutarate ferredoxin oxidoreductase subunit alpha|nr:2-oxoacid:acceptor oxidoreductase subunit alpha [Flavobacteriaceae bacterium]NVJ73092.1 2-oxoacid:acceptor oxidoreductase subunit alpha [Flavobacteriaceae bacterium]
MNTNKTNEVESVVIRFVGDSGDGMQLTGSQFTDTAAMLGNDIATFPNYPAEIRAPQGSLYGVSGFQVQIGSVEINTPGDELDLLVAMNPAGLKTNLASLKPGHTLIVDSDSFNSKNLQKAGYTSNPLEDGSLNNYRLLEVQMTTLTKGAVKDVEGLDNKTITRSKNMFALGMVYWMYHRSTAYTINFFNKKFKNHPHLIEANTKVLKAGYNYADTLQLISNTYKVAPAKMEKGTYRIIMGNTALAWGFLAAAERSKLNLFLGSYPITPASDILHELSKHRHFGVTTFQAEDEIAGITSAIGASFAGKLAITTTSGPGLALKGEALGLAVMTELPLVVVNVQRGGPSTGLPTKTEQSDLLQAMYGRNGESPVIVIAASTPSNCFDYAYEASRIAIEHMTPVILLSDGYIANGTGPWKIKKSIELDEITPRFIQADQIPEQWHPYQRDESNLARDWALPGLKGFEHRIGGLEKDLNSGNVSYDPINHEKITKIRAAKIELVKNKIPHLDLKFNSSGALLVVGWGGTYGSLFSAVKDLVNEEDSIGFVHFNYINPMPSNTEAVLRQFKTILVCELNNGQLSYLLQSRFEGLNIKQYNKIQGLPFSKSELKHEFKKYLN